MLTRLLARATLGSTLALILAGGLVTNTGSALAVPDWPTTFGYNMFRYPWSQMVGGVLYEHSHRLLGALVGFLTVALALSLWFTEERTWVRALGCAAVVAVLVQGTLGGLRVVLQRDAIAIVHGCLAQAFFALTVILVLVTAGQWREAPPVPVRPRLRWLAAGAAGLVYLQIVFGALLTHAGRIDLHLIGAAAVFVVVPMVTAGSRATGYPAVARTGRWLLALLFLQAALGVGAYLARFSSALIPGGQLAVVLLPVVHRLVGALVLGSAVALSVLLARARRELPATAVPMAALPAEVRS